MRTKVLIAGTLALGLLVAGMAIGEAKSGLQKGDATPAFNVTAVNGPDAGKSLCYI